MNRGVGSNFGLVRQLNIGQANVLGWAGLVISNFLRNIGQANA